jgi:Mn-containing catalase
LADALPQIIDKATKGDSSLASNLLEQVGGVDGAMDMLVKFMV